jgi:hypothetical protein
MIGDGSLSTDRSGIAMMRAPRTEVEVNSLLEAGLLTESRSLDLKASLASSAHANKELAKDLASFSLEGGALLIGIREEKETRSFALAPIDLVGLAERVDQVATSRIEPALTVRSIEIPCEANPGTGYLYVEVPPSALAPHMTDGRYYARADTTTRQLSDTEVACLHGERVVRQESMRARLRAEIAADPFPSHRQHHVHFYLLAEPLTLADEAAEDLVWEAQTGGISRLLGDLATEVPDALRATLPSPDELYRREHRARGVGYTSGLLNSTAGESWGDEDLADVEVRVSGGIRVMIGAGSIREPVRGHEYQGLSSNLLVAWAYRTVLASRNLAQTLSYRGPWRIGIAVTNLRGVVGFKPVSTYRVEVAGATYDESEYLRSVEVSAFDLEDRPAEVVARLVKSLLRPLGLWAHYRVLLGE